MGSIVADVVRLTGRALLALLLASPVCGEVHAVFIPPGESLPCVSRSEALFITHLYIAAIDVERHSPSWIVYKVSRGDFNENHMERHWRTHFPQSLEAADYKKSGYQIGHLYAVASVDALRHAYEVNYTDVCAPMRPKLNGDYFAKYEQLIRDLADQYGEVYVMVRCLWRKPMPRLPNADEPHEIPSHFLVRISYGDTVAERTFANE